MKKKLYVDHNLLILKLFKIKMMSEEKIIKEFMRVAADEKAEVVADLIVDEAGLNSATYFIPTDEAVVVILKSLGLRDPLKIAEFPGLLKLLTVHVVDEHFRIRTRSTLKTVYGNKILYDPKARKVDGIPIVGMGFLPKFKIRMVFIDGFLSTTELNKALTNWIKRQS